MGLIFTHPDEIPLAVCCINGRDYNGHVPRFCYDSNASPCITLAFDGDPAQLFEILRTQELVQLTIRSPIVEIDGHVFLLSITMTNTGPGHVRMQFEGRHRFLLFDSEGKHATQEK